MSYVCVCPLLIKARYSVDIPELGRECDWLCESRDWWPHSALVPLTRGMGWSVRGLHCSHGAPWWQEVAG